MIIRKDKHYYCQILGVQENAEEDEIKLAYRRLAKKYHPDLNKEDPSANERFLEIKEAYDYLCDEGKTSQGIKIRRTSVYETSRDPFFGAYEKMMRDIERKIQNTIWNFERDFVNRRREQFRQRYRKFRSDTEFEFWEGFDTRFKNLLKKLMHDFW